MTYEEATEEFDREYARSNGFGRCGLPTAGWTSGEVQKFVRRCDSEANTRGAVLKGALVGFRVARQLGINDAIGLGSFFESIPCFVTGDDDRIDLIFGPA